MKTCFSTFITGLQEVVECALKQELKNVQVKLLLDGLVIYETIETFEKVKNLCFLNNSFFLFASFRGDLDLSGLMNKVLQDPKAVSPIPKGFLRSKQTFRVIASDQNQLVSVAPRQQKEIEVMLAEKLKLNVDRSLPDVEVWFLKRSERYGLVGLRISKTPNYEKLLKKGELRPELANLMCQIAQLKPGDIVLDPFAGFGAIPFECARAFTVKKIIAQDKDEKIVKYLKSKALKDKLRVEVKRGDALNMKSLTNKRIDKIITDPPWGLYEKRDNLPDFYKRMLNEFTRVLKPGGVMVILTAQKKLFEKLVKKGKAFVIKKKYNTLVSGQKAGIYKVTKLLQT